MEDRARHRRAGSSRSTCCSSALDARPAARPVGPPRRRTRPGRTARAAYAELLAAVGLLGRAPADDAERERARPALDRRRARAGRRPRRGRAGAAPLRRVGRAARRAGDRAPSLGRLAAWSGRRGRPTGHGIARPLAPVPEVDGVRRVDAGEAGLVGAHRRRAAGARRAATGRSSPSQRSAAAVWCCSRTTRRSGTPARARRQRGARARARRRAGAAGRLRSRACTATATCDGLACDPVRAGAGRSAVLVAGRARLDGRREGRRLGPPERTAAGARAAAARVRRGARSHARAGHARLRRWAKLVRAAARSRARGAAGTCRAAAAYAGLEPDETRVLAEGVRDNEDLLAAGRALARLERGRLARAVEADS